MIRYIVVPFVLSKHHPMWPNEQVFYIKDLNNGTLSFSCYKTYEEAEKVAHRKNLTFSV